MASSPKPPAEEPAGTVPGRRRRRYGGPDRPSFYQADQRVIEPVCQNALPSLLRSASRSRVSHKEARALPAVSRRLSGCFRWTAGSEAASTAAGRFWCERLTGQRRSLGPVVDPPGQALAASPSSARSNSLTCTSALPPDRCKNARLSSPQDAFELRLYPRVCSSPLEGSQLPRGPGGLGAPVVSAHHPWRDRNSSVRSPRRQPSRLLITPGGIATRTPDRAGHRRCVCSSPLEGSQLRRRRDEVVRLGVCSSPLEGSQLQRPLAAPPAVPSAHHPWRDRNMSHSLPPWAWMFSSAHHPWRDRNRRGDHSGRPATSSAHHPWRDRNWLSTWRVCLLVGSAHHPWRDRNRGLTASTPRVAGVCSSPLEGSQPETRGRLS